VGLPTGGRAVPSKAARVSTGPVRPHARQPGSQDFLQAAGPPHPPSGAAGPRAPDGARFKRNDQRNWFDPGNDCQKVANITSRADSAELDQRAGSGTAATARRIRSIARRKIPGADGCGQSHRRRSRCMPRPARSSRAREPLTWAVAAHDRRGQCSAPLAAAWRQAGRRTCARDRSRRPPHVPKPFQPRALDPPGADRCRAAFAARRRRRSRGRRPGAARGRPPAHRAWKYRDQNSGFRVANPVAPGYACPKSLGVNGFRERRYR
jgi:hypothetical protein